MLNHLVNHFNETTTENGALAYKSTKSYVLDMFAEGGAMRNRNDFEIVQLFSKAFAEDATLAMKTLFYLRDIKSGQGERKFFKLALKHLAVHNQDSLLKNLHLIPEFGRWDDMWVLLDTDAREHVGQLVALQLKKDKLSEKPSLLAKWMPSENASSETTKSYARTFITLFGTTPRKYRKLISSLRAKISLVETKMTEGEYETIEYDKLPSIAGMKYRQAFFRNDEVRYKEFLDSLSKGEVKVNAGTLYPNDIVGKILSSRGYGISSQEAKLFEGQWNNLPDFIGENQEESIVMADVSGSMTGKPMEVSIALAMYIAERNKGTFHNHFMTFSERPAIVKIQGATIAEKTMNLRRASWGYNTDFDKALRVLLNVAIKNGIPQEEMVKKIYVISDMQFDSASGHKTNIFHSVAKEYARHGYQMPNIVFWNVRATDNQPATMNEEGVQLVSGFSPSILTSLLSADGKTPYDFMIDVINSERYAEVTA